MEGNTGLEMIEEQNEQTEQEDIISTMPDEILTRILSILRTEKAVQTCILSSRWKNLWTSIYNLHFDSECYPARCQTGRPKYFKYSQERKIEFAKFVERVLARLYEAKNIQSLRLKCSGIASNSRINSWINFALNRNVHSVYLTIQIGSQKPILPQLPQSILTCKALVKLSVNKDFALNIPDSAVCFPSLKILSLSLSCPDVDLINKIFCSCPVLEELSFSLHMPWYSDKKMLSFNIFIPTLKRLSVFSKQNFVVKTPNLEYLKITLSMCYLVNEMPFVSEAYMKLGEHPSQCVLSRADANCTIELLRGIDNTKFLTLCSYSMAALLVAFNGNFPTFPNLSQLDLESNSGWKLLPHFLSNSPTLKKLSLHKKDYRRRDDSGEPISGNFDGEKPGSVPSCLLLHLKFITISYSSDLGDDDLEMAKYLLKNCEVLEKFRLGCWGPVNRIIRKHIRMCPRGSKSCKIEYF